MSSEESSDASSSSSGRDVPSDTSSTNSSSSETQVPFKVSADQHLRIQYRHSIVQGQAGELFPRTAQELEVFQSEMRQGVQIQKRLAYFDQISQDIVPSGLQEFRQTLMGMPVRCPECMCVFSIPLSFPQCGHSICLECMRQRCRVESEGASIPQAERLVSGQVEMACPVCKEKGFPFYNKAVHAVSHRFNLIFPGDAVGGHDYNPAQPKCFGCKKELSVEKNVQKHADDEKQGTQLTFVTDLCVFCRRYACPECAEKYYLQKKLADWDGKEVLERLQFKAERYLTTLNAVEQKRLLEKRSVEEIWNAFVTQLQELYYLPISQYKDAPNCIDADQKCCERCLHHVFDLAAHYDRARLQIPDIPKCLCGDGCRLQFCDEAHARDCQHAGPGTRGEQSLSIWG